jgi:hypothetical protein
VVLIEITEVAGTDRAEVDIPRILTAEQARESARHVAETRRRMGQGAGAYAVKLDGVDIGLV